MVSQALFRVQSLLSRVQVGSEHTAHPAQITGLGSDSLTVWHTTSSRWAPVKHSLKEVEVPPRVVPPPSCAFCGTHLWLFVGLVLVVYHLQSPFDRHQTTQFIVSHHSFQQKHNISFFYILAGQLRVIHIREKKKLMKIKGCVSVKEKPLNKWMH